MGKIATWKDVHDLAGIITINDEVKCPTYQDLLSITSVQVSGIYKSNQSVKLSDIGKPNVSFLVKDYTVIRSNLTTIINIGVDAPEGVRWSCSWINIPIPTTISNALKNTTGIGSDEFNPWFESMSYPPVGTYKLGLYSRMSLMDTFTLTVKT